MAKANNSNKVSFGKRRCGKYKKTSGPKDKPVKPYNRQGRQYENNRNKTEPKQSQNYQR